MDSKICQNTESPTPTHISSSASSVQLSTCGRLEN